MDSTLRDIDVSGDYEEIPPIRDSTSTYDPLTNTNPQTVRGYEQRLQELNRENFDLKLRIYFLENNNSNRTDQQRSIQQNSRSSSQNIYPDYYSVPPADYGNSHARSPRSLSRHSSDFVSNQENDNSRRRSKPNSDESDDNTSTLNRHSDNRRRRSQTPSANSDLFTPMPTSTANIQFDDRERRFQEENTALKQEISAVNARLNETSNQLRHAQQQYENELRKNEDQQVKAERVIKRLQADYDERIANLEHEQRQKLAQYDSYRHEQDHKNTNVNIDEYLRQIEQQQRIIDDLNNRLKSQKPYTVLLPSQTANDTAQPLEDQIKSYVETIDQLRAECDELQRSEKHLRKKIDELNRLIEPSTGLLLTNNRSSIVDDAEQTEDPQSTIIQISLQLRNDAENVSGLTNRIAQLMREREDNQNKLKEKDSQIRQYEIREIEFENRTKQKYELQIEGLQHDIEHLQKQLENRERRLQELTEDNHLLTSQSRQQNNDLERQLQQERDDLQDQLNIADQHINDLREELDKQHHQYDILLTDYEKLKETLNNANIDALENAIQEKERQIETFHAQLQENETNFQQQRIALERERDFERGKVDEVNNELDDYKRNFTDLEQRYAQLQLRLNEQQTQNQQIQELQQELAQIQQEKGNLTDELEFLKQEKLAMSENDAKLLELTQSNEDLQGELSRFQVHIQDNEDEIKRLMHELNTLRDENEALTQELDALKSNFNRMKNDLTNSELERDQLQNDNLGLKQENNKLKHQLEELEPQLREQLKDEYDNTSNQRINDITKARDAEVENLQRDRENLEFELEQLNTEKKRLEKQKLDLENELQQANETIDNNERELAQLRRDLNQLPRTQDLEQQYRAKILQLEEQIQAADYDKVQASSNNQQLIQQLENKIQERDDLIKNCRNNQTNKEQESTEIQLRLQIQIQGLEQELESKERLIDQYTGSVQEKDGQIDQLTEEKNFLQEDYEKQINELKVKLREYKRQLDDAEQTNDLQRLQIEDLLQQIERLTLSPTDQQICLKQIEDLQRQLQMEKKSNESSLADQHNQYKNVIDDLKAQLQRREEENQRSNYAREFNKNLRRSILPSDQTQTNSLQTQMQTDQLTTEIESLRKRLADQEREINKLREDNLAKDQKLAEADPRRVPPKTDAASMIASLKLDLQKQDREIIDLKQQLSETRQEKPDQSDSSSSSVIPRESRPRSHQNFENLDREELLYELEQTLKQVEELNKQLNDKFPSLTELHKQLVEVRHELSRQKYVNQVLWRKLNALIDIHGSNTRHELAIELANYQDEIAKLKAYRNPSIVKRADSRASSEQNLSLFSMDHDYPSTNIKSTIALLERSNIEWQTKLARLTEQLGRSESQSRNYQRELIKCQQLLSDAGLIDLSIRRRRRRRSADDSTIINIDHHDDLDHIHDVNELRDLLRNQQKYNQQLQTKIRLHTTESLAATEIERLNDQIQNLNLINETYKHELKRSSKTLDQNRQQYEQLKTTLTKYERILQKHNIDLSLFNEKQNYLIDEFLIETKSEPSANKTDSGIDSTTDAIELQRQLKDKDDEIQTLNNELNDRYDEVRQLTNQLNNAKRNAGNQQDLFEELEQARLQIETMKPQYEENPRLHDEIKQLKADLERSKSSAGRPISSQFEEFTQRRNPLNENDTSEILIRRTDLAQLLEEIRLLRRDLERSLQKQNELQSKLDENIRQSQSPREFTFSGRGVSYPDLRLIENANLFSQDTLPLSTSNYTKRSRPVGSSSTELDHIEIPHLLSRESEQQQTIMKSYVVGEIQTHNELQRLIEEIKLDFKAINAELKQKLRSKTNPTDFSPRSIDEHLISLDERLANVLGLLQTYEIADLPEKNKEGQRIFFDLRLEEEIQRLRAAQRKYIQDIQHLRQKNREQATYLDQLLTQLTKTNRKKTDTGDYLALLLRPTLDVLQKARSNIENHLKDTNSNQIPPGSAQQHRRHHRSNRQD